MFLLTSKPLLLPLNFESSSLGFQSQLPRLLPVSSQMELLRKLGRNCCVSYSMKKNKQLEVIESGSDAVSGEDVFDSVSTGAEVPPDHLVIMVNGIIGSAADWRYAAKQFVKRLPNKVIVHCSDCNSSTLTFDGVDRMGERLAEELPFLCGLPFLERRAPQAAHWIVGRSGKHLFLTDNDNEGHPLLLQMVNDTDNIKFMSALGSFKRRVAYANANYDQVVGWRTSSIRRHHELPESNLLVKDEKYPHIVYVEREIIYANQNGMISVDIPQNVEEEMIRGLTQVPWERVDVSFHKSTQRYTAHSTIQVKNYWLNSDGADVVLHMIDNFLL